MVERFNRALLQFLRTYVTSQHDGETYLPHVLYAYRTSQHTSTRVNFTIFNGRQPAPCQPETQFRGVARILQRGFPLVVDPRRGGLGAQPPEADE